MTPAPGRDEQDAADEHDAAEDESIRAAVSRQWAQDWDSPDDAAYDAVTPGRDELREQIAADLFAAHMLHIRGDRDLPLPTWDQAPLYEKAPYYAMALSVDTWVAAHTEQGAEDEQVAALPEAWTRKSREWYYENRHTHPNGIDFCAGFEEGWDHAADLLRAALDPPTEDDASRSQTDARRTQDAADQPPQHE